MEDPQIALDPALQAATRQERAAKLSRAAANLPTPKSAGVLSEHFAVASALIAKTKSLLLEAARVNSVGTGAATAFGGHEKDAAADVASTRVPEYGEK